MSETKTYRALRALYYPELGVIDRDTQVELTDAQYVVNAKSLVEVKQPLPEKSTEGGDGDPQPNSDPPSGGDPVPDGDPSHDDGEKGEQNEPINDDPKTGTGDEPPAGDGGAAGKKPRGSKRGGKRNRSK